MKYKPIDINLIKKVLYLLKNIEPSDEMVYVDHGVHFILNKDRVLSVDVHFDHYFRFTRWPLMMGIKTIEISLNEPCYFHDVNDSMNLADILKMTKFERIFTIRQNNEYKVNEEIAILNSDDDFETVKGHYINDMINAVYNEQQNFIDKDRGYHNNKRKTMISKERNDAIRTMDTLIEN